MGADTAPFYAKKEKVRKDMGMDSKQVKANLKEMGVCYQEREPEKTLTVFIRQCGYETHPIIVNLSEVETVDADIGVIVTHEKPETNNGVYIFCVLKNEAVGLITVIPSTVTKGPMVRRVIGDVTNAITGLDTPPLTPFDMIEVAGQVIANTIMKDLMTAYNIPKEKEQAFLCMYLPKFLANVAMYYTGAAGKDKKPMVNEEAADMEPAQVRQILMGGNAPKWAGKEKEEESEEGKKDVRKNT